MNRTSRIWKSGEPFVWFTSMGLAVGLSMVVVLLLVIMANGIWAFWPRRVVLFHLKDNSPASIRGSRVIAGEITKHRPALNQDGIDDDQQPDMELQLFVANRDVYGFSFKYLNEKEIEKTETPLDMMVLERLEYGNVIGFPQYLLTHDQVKISAASPEFSNRLLTAIEVVGERWDEIRRIEKKEIGSINLQMEKLRVEQKSLDRRKDQQTTTERRSEIQEELAKLQSSYETLAQQVGGLREEQNRETLVVQLPTGEEKVIPVGQIVSCLWPNRLNFFERLVLFFEKFWNFVIQDPREANTEGGIFPAIFGTFVMTLIMSIIVMPFGVLAAIYLREYARQGLFVQAVRIAVNNLAGVPSIVFGVFGLGFFVYLSGGTIDSLFFQDRLPTPTFGTGGILWAGLTLALMTLPVVIVSTEEGLASVPRGMREASLALGASKWQTIQRVVLPASSPGMLTGLILAMARGAGEVAPLMLVGVVKLAPSLPLDSTYPFIHLERKFMHLGFHIYDLGFQSPDSEAARPMVFATTFLLILLVVILNLSAIIIREKLRKKYARSIF